MRQTYSTEIASVVERLNHTKREERLQALIDVETLRKAGELTTEATDEVNNHVHTIYSFSPYSPAMAAFRAWEAGLKAVGIMDHDSIAGAHEMIEAGKRVGIATTVGFEVRVNFSHTVVENRKINSPDSKNIAYIAIHGIPHDTFDEVQAFLEPLNDHRNERNKKQIQQLNLILEETDLGSIDFYTDVYPLSQAAQGGSITERHILFALTKRLLTRCGKGKPLISFLEMNLNINIPKKIREYLLDTENPHYEFDLLGVLKSSFLPRIFIQPDYNECPSVFDVVEFANRIGAIPAYAYLGDITESPTGDKKAEQFEDQFLDQLMEELKRIGFKAITYMPPRNTREQLTRVQNLCKEHGFMEISGVDINSSRQTFNCPIILDSQFIHLAGATWALIAHEYLAGSKRAYSLFSRKNPLREVPLEERLERYSRLGRAIDPGSPESIIEMVDF
jgi:predicted metal-dependent phosphoesterase TrpH